MIAMELTPEFRSFYEKKIKSGADGLESIRKNSLRKMLVPIGIATVAVIVVSGVVSKLELSNDTLNLIFLPFGFAWIGTIVYSIKNRQKNFRAGNEVMDLMMNSLVRYIDSDLDFHPDGFVKPEEARYADICSLFLGANENNESYLFNLKGENLIKGKYKGKEIKFSEIQMAFHDGRGVPKAHMRNNITTTNGMGDPRMRRPINRDHRTDRVVFHSKTNYPTKEHIIFMETNILGKWNTFPENLLRTGDEQFDKTINCFSRYHEAVQAYATSENLNRIKLAFEDSRVWIISIYQDNLTVIFHQHWYDLFEPKTSDKINRPEDYQIRVDHLKEQIEIGIKLST